MSPLAGYCYLTLLGWYCYSLDLGGTDVYALILLFPPLIFLYLAHKKHRKQPTISGRLFDRELIAPLIIGVMSFLVLSVPLLTEINGLTSISPGNNDIADSASTSTYLKEFASSDNIGFLGQSTIFKYLADQLIFGGSLSTAFASSLFSLETYQLQSMSIHIFFLFSVLLVYPLAREFFCYNYYTASGITALYGLSPIMYYTVYSGFQGQLIATGLALCIFLLHLHAINYCNKVSDYCGYIPFAVLFNWGISLTYPHMLPFIYAPLVVYLIVLCFHARSYHIFFNWTLFVIAVLGLTFILSPYRARVSILDLVMLAKIEAGWYMPWFSPDTIFGLTFSKVYLNAHKWFIRFLLSVPLLIIIVCGFIKAYKRDLRILLLSGSFLFVLLAGYIMLCYMGRADVGWGGYKSYKLLSFFLPLILLSSLILFSNEELPSNHRVYYLLPISLTLLIACNFFSSGAVSMRVSMVHRAVSPDMAELKKIGGNPLVESVNILGTDWWDILWEANFLMRKKLYFETSTYAGRTASSLDGKWNLIHLIGGSPEDDDKSFALSEEIIPVNASYILVRSDSRTFPVPASAANAFKSPDLSINPR